MRKESAPIQEQLIGNIIDKEFSELETEFSFDDRGPLVRQLVAEVFDIHSSLRQKTEQSTEVKEKLAKAGESLKHYFLPDIPGGDLEQGLETTREGYDGRAQYFKTADRVFIKVGQGEMWKVPKSENPYLTTATSECSTLVGIAADAIIVAHTSFSTLDQTEAVLDFMRQQGVDKEKFFVVASIGDFQRQQSEQEDNSKKRATTAEAYVVLGVPDGNIKTFVYKPSSNTGKDYQAVDRGLVGVIVNKDGLYMSQFDLLHTKRSSEKFGTETTVQNIIDKEPLPFSSL